MNSGNGIILNIQERTGFTSILPFLVGSSRFRNYLYTRIVTRTVKVLGTG